ncbi:hypothetical protein [Bradyrhizobium sp. OAE829]|uniref:hypothetical protein n=1 Tax=Bradyrhizobium sp. OAE829 TaxID=2663807 RepID=UPI00178A2B6E
MTLLITLAGAGYALACSDMRISVEKNGVFTPLDETFNKHIVFRSGGINANISYTGVARWTIKGRTVNLYDVISDAAIEAADDELGFGPFTLKIVDRILKELEAPELQRFRKSLEFELHITGYHEKIPFPFVAVLSTYRKAAPWSVTSDIQYEYQFPWISVYLKLAETPDVVFGGADHFLTSQEKRTIFEAACNGADAFNMARLSAKLTENVSRRTTAVGPKSVSIVLPTQGFLDTNFWERSPTGINAFVPRIIFAGGGMMGPSVFPVEMQLTTKGHLPKQGLFFKSVIANSYKKSERRRTFRHRGGKAIPGIMGLIMLAFYGKVPDGYEDFGFGETDA